MNVGRTNDHTNTLTHVLGSRLSLRMISLSHPSQRCTHAARARTQSSSQPTARDTLPAISGLHYQSSVRAPNTENTPAEQYADILTKSLRPGSHALLLDRLPTEQKDSDNKRASSSESHIDSTTEGVLVPSQEGVSRGVHTLNA